MATMAQIRGMLLEEVLLYLIRHSGYTPVADKGQDNTLCPMAGGLGVRGRGTQHQVDVIADFCFYPPFSHPQRLLLEAKCYSKEPIGLSTVRNAMAVLSDVNQFWSPLRETVCKRYHYHFAIFSTSEFTKEAQQFAFAHDIYLIPLQQSPQFKTITKAIRGLCYQAFSAQNEKEINIEMKILRDAFRGAILHGNKYQLKQFPPLVEEQLQQIIDVSHNKVGYALLAVLNDGFPIFLIPATNVIIPANTHAINIRIRWTPQGIWSITDRSDKLLFTFDLPTTFFELYMGAKVISPSRLRTRRKEESLSASDALYLKGVAMDSFYAIRKIDDSVDILRFQLDMLWFQQIKKGIKQRRHEEEADTRTAENHEIDREE